MDTNEVQDTAGEDVLAPPRTPVAPIENRFLFVDVAAMRAKQLRRGALPRLGQPEESDTYRQEWHKAERVAMEEVRRGLVEYNVPEPVRAGKES